MSIDTNEELDHTLGVNLEAWLKEHNLQQHRKLLVKYGIINFAILQYACQHQCLQEMIDEMHEMDQKEFLKCLRKRFGNKQGSTVNLIFIEKAHAKIKQMEETLVEIKDNLKNGQKYIDNVNHFNEYIIGLNENVENKLQTLKVLQKQTNEIFTKIQGI